MSFLGKYYTLKIEASTELVLLKGTKDEMHRKNAVEYWTNNTVVSEKNYSSQMLARTRESNWRLQLEEVKKDVILAREIRF